MQPLPSRLHCFSSDTSTISTPREFTNPFNYTPHPLCVRAAEEVRAYLLQQEEWQEELERGKMFGVVVVCDAMGNRGFLAGFSGMVAGSSTHPYFVPPIYNLQDPTGYFKQEEARISALNASLKEREQAPNYLAVLSQLSQIRHQWEVTIGEKREEFALAKQRRNALRAIQINPEVAQGLIRESQFQKAELKRLQQRRESEVARAEEVVEGYLEPIRQLKQERKKRSAALQQWLLEQYILCNGRGESCNLYELFIQSAHRMPPAGSGECAAPKLMQYAYLHHLTPIAMAEFWWGNSPTHEIRHHGYYYTACKSKCEPILTYMLQGLTLAKEMPYNYTLESEIEIVYEDETLLVVNKPEGMLSVPGKEEKVSLQEIVAHRYGEIFMVHRLDMDTSGLLIIAKSCVAYHHLQRQFAAHTIEKRYIALLEGSVELATGVIELPLCLDPMERPKQQVNYQLGKRAITHYRVIETEARATRIALYPLTGRTHQLRVHMAHNEGLNCPIQGDRLYGVESDRLYLHAERIVFTHPSSGERVVVEAAAPF